MFQCASNTEMMMSHFKFLENLGYALVIAHVQDRISAANLSSELKGMIENFLRELGINLPSTQQRLRTRRHGRVNIRHQ